MVGLNVFMVKLKINNMKNLEDIIKQKSVFLGNWKESSEIIKDFKIKKDSLKGIKILFACYKDRGYSGDAFVLFEKNGELFEVNTTACSIYGVEQQWKPEETNLTAIQYRLSKGTLGRDVDKLMYNNIDEENEFDVDNIFALELKQFLGIN